MKTLTQLLSEELGDCYQAAGRFVMDKQFTEKNSKYILVHGEVTGQGRLDGVKYGHAWVEKGDIVYDMSNNREIVIQKELYYMLGKIDEKGNKRYTYKEMQKEILRTEHWGSW